MIVKTMDSGLTRHDSSVYTVGIDAGLLRAISSDSGRTNTTANTMDITGEHGALFSQPQVSSLSQAITGVVNQGKMMTAALLAQVSKEENIAVIFKDVVGTKAHDIRTDVDRTTGFALAA